MDVSIGIMAYNEEKNIRFLLDELVNQEMDNTRIKEIIVVNDGSIDNTLKLIKQVKDSRIKVINHTTRLGKYQAINTFLKNAKSEILVLESADNIPKRDAIENIVGNFENKSVGIVASRIVPLKSNKFGNYIYYLHDLVSKEKPKYGELIAFRNVVKEIPPTSVDEEMIGKLVIDKGFIGIYEPKSIVYIKTPSSLRELIKQRRRINCGHKEIYEEYKYLPASYGFQSIFRAWLKSFKEYPFHLVIYFTGIEILNRIFGFYDYLTNKEKHYKWEMINSIKKIK